MNSALSVHPHTERGDTIAANMAGGTPKLRCRNNGPGGTELDVYISTVEDARQLAVAAVEILDHLRRAEGVPITKRDSVSVDGGDLPTVNVEVAS